jgi:hypothetical protein
MEIYKRIAILEMMFIYRELKEKRWKSTSILLQGLLRGSLNLSKLLNIVGGGAGI